jgi:hypothetical protein
VRIAGHQESSPNGESEGLLQKYPFALFRCDLCDLRVRLVLHRYG